MGEHTDLYDQTVSCIERYATFVKNNTKDHEQVQSIFCTLQSQIEYCCSARERSKAIGELLAESLDSVTNSDDVEQVKNIQKIFDDSLKQIQKKDFTKSSPNILNQLMGDEDIQMVKSSQNVIDPISKKRFVDPVKNTQCGHSYEKTAVLALISKNPKTRCPIFGCSAEQYIYKKHLVPDTELKRFLDSNTEESINGENSQIVSLDDTQ